MTISLILFHVAVAAALFIGVNWLGSHVRGFGYKQLTVTATPDEAPAFNFVFRVCAPLVGLSVTAALLYAFRLDRFVEGLYWVAVYYVALRVAFILVTGRARLLNWPAHLAVGACVIGSSWLLHVTILQHRRNILPDFTTISNEFWLLVVLFIFQAANRYRSSSVGTERRKLQFIEQRYLNLRATHGPIIAQLPSRELQALAYSVAIYESFNRPAIYRWLERHVLHPIGMSRTLGIMQVATDRRVSDTESVRIGTQKLRSDYERAVSEHEEQLRGTSEYLTYTAIRQAVSSYNKDDSYVGEVLAIYDLLSSTIHTKADAAPPAVTQPSAAPRNR